MRLNRQVRQERQEEKMMVLILAFLVNLAVQSFLCDLSVKIFLQSAEIAF